MSEEVIPEENAATETFNYATELGRLGPEYNQNPNFTKHKDLPALLKSYDNQASMIGRDKISLPNAEDPKDIARALKELGRPDSHDEYEPVTMPEGEADAIGWNGAFESKINQALYDSGMTQGMHSLAVPKLIAVLREEESGMFEAGEQQAQDADRALRQEYGTEYEARLDAGNRAARSFFGENWQEFSQLQFRDGTRPANNPGMLKFLIEVGQRYAIDDDTAPGNGPRVGAGLDPATAKSQIAQLEGDPAFREKWLTPEHPQHTEALSELSRLYDYAHPKR
jgi:hypothetical protein